MMALATLGGAALAGALLGAPRQASETPDPVGAHHRAMVASIERGETNVDQIQMCFAPGTNGAVVAAFAEAVERAAPDRYQQTNRWSGPVALGIAGPENEPLTLTYSFVPDGTSIANGIGEGVGPSTLFAKFDGIYGDTQTWQDLFHEVFDRWEGVCGLSYVYEPNDDGAMLFSAPGVAGVRGDLRISAKFIDGPSNVLAYNNFPSGGDMVIDSGDTFYNNTEFNSRRLRNVVAHEHGHGMGQLHNCPILGGKLMEPFVNTDFDGPLHDDVRNAQDMYGDIAEPNDSAGAAHEIGTIAMGDTARPGQLSPGIDTTSGLSLNELDLAPFTNDEDWFRFSTSGEGTFSVELAPVGFTYEDNPQACGGQPGSCCSGSFVDSKRIVDLRFQLIADDGSTVLADVDDAAIGLREMIEGWPVSGPETFYIRVYTEFDAWFESQMYDLIIETATPPAPTDFDLVFPLNGTTGLETGPVLDWEESVGADSYTVEIDNNIDFSSPLVVQVVGAPATELDLGDGTLAHDTQYFWRVSSENAYGGALCFPAFASFRTAPFVPPPGCDADIDGDGDTDVFDFAVLAAAFGSPVTPGTQGDYDGNGAVDVFDFALFASDFGCVPDP